MERLTSWGWMLTRDRLFCKVCGHTRTGAERWIRIGVPTRECNPINPKTRRSFFAMMRRNFKAHVAAEHPEWMDRIDWKHRL